MENKYALIEYFICLIKNFKKSNNLTKSYCTYDNMKCKYKYSDLSFSYPWFFINYNKLESKHDISFKLDDLLAQKICKFINDYNYFEYLTIILKTKDETKMKDITLEISTKMFIIMILFNTFSYIKDDSEYINYNIDQIDYILLNTNETMYNSMYYKEYLFPANDQIEEDKSNWIEMYSFIMSLNKLLPFFFFNNINKMGFPCIDIEPVELFKARNCISNDIDPLLNAYVNLYEKYNITNIGKVTYYSCFYTNYYQKNQCNLQTNPDLINEFLTLIDTPNSQLESLQGHSTVIQILYLFNFIISTTMNKCLSSNDQCDLSSPCAEFIDNSRKDFKVNAGKQKIKPIKDIVPLVKDNKQTFLTSILPHGLVILPSPDQLIKKFKVDYIKK